MTKIPVGRTIARAYSFLFHNIGAVIAVTWLPVVLMTAVQLGAALYDSAHHAELEANVASAVGVYALLSFVAFVVAFFCMAVAAVGVTRLALGALDKIPFPYFPVGPTERRMIGAYIRYFLGLVVLFVFAAIVSVLALTLAGFNPQQGTMPPPNAATLLATAISIVVFLYALIAGLRMGLLLAPVVVVEGKGLQRANALTKGNFLRILAVILACVVPFILLLVAGEAVILAAYLGPDFAQVLAAGKMQDRADEAMASQAIPWAAFTAILVVLMFGLAYSAYAFIYREIVPELPEGGAS